MMHILLARDMLCFLRKPEELLAVSNIVECLIYQKQKIKNEDNIMDFAE